jgi:hypothetical protein
VTVLVQHSKDCPHPGLGHSDAAKRIFDTYTLHRVADPMGSLGQWFAFRLSDGTTDNVLYDGKSSAAHYQKHDEKYYGYIQVTMARMTICSAEAYLMLLRRMSDAGIRQVDPDHARGGREVIKRSSSEDQLAQVFGRSQNLLTARQKAEGN